MTNFGLKYASRTFCWAPTSWLGGMLYQQASTTTTTTELILSKSFFIFMKAKTIKLGP